MKEEKIEELFVATLAVEQRELVEPWVQYESFGRIDHNYIITPKKRLVCSKYDKKNNLRYYDYGTGNEVHPCIVKPYSTTSSPSDNLYLDWRSGIIPASPFWKEYKEKKERELQSLIYTHLVPFSEYIKNKLGITAPKNPAIANAILKIIPSGHGYINYTVDNYNDPQTENSIKSL